MKTIFRIFFGAALVAFLFSSNLEPVRTPIFKSQSTANAGNLISGTTHFKISKSSIGCDPTLWNYVYHSNRFKVYEACKTVSGTIIGKHDNDDGDIHLQLRLNGNSSLLNAKNISEQNGCLVLEIICAKKVTQIYAISP